jgi:hypothetical protein
MTAVGKLIGPALASAALCVGIIGCTPERHSAIPADAQMVASGDKSVSYQAPHDGMVYVYNRGDGKLLYTGPIEKGQTVSVDPATNHLTLDGRMLSDRPIQAGDIKLYFKSTGQTDVQSHTTIQRSTETTVHDHNNTDTTPMD